jgi:hypothetical protein
LLITESATKQPVSELVRNGLESHEHAWTLKNDTVKETHIRINFSPKLAPMTIGRPLTIFFTLAYAISWLVFIPIILWHASIQLIAVASFGPTMAALITQRLTAGDYRAFPFHWLKRRTLVATAVGALLIAALVGITRGRLSYHWEAHLSEVIADPHPAAAADRSKRSG